VKVGPEQVQASSTKGIVDAAVRQDTTRARVKKDVVDVSD
jgi:hypothetical protein